MSMAVGLSTFLSAAAAYMVLRYFLKWPAGCNWGFLAGVILMMIGVNHAIMNAQCGKVDAGTLWTATLVPWVVMFGTILAVLQMFPGWLQPFSNTFGYMIALIAGGKGKLLAILKQDGSDPLKWIVDDPGLLINQFSMVNFDQTLKSLEAVLVPGANVEPFKDIVRLKELVAEYVWFALVGIMALTTSYNILVNYKCTVKGDPPPEPPPDATREYDVDE